MKIGRAARRLPGTSQPAGLRAAAVVFLRNEIAHIDGLIGHLVGEGLDVVVIDNQSSDGSVERLRDWMARGLLAVHERTYTGVWNIAEAIGWRYEIVAQLDHDWVVAVDADEWLHPARPDDRLLDLLTRADRAGATAVNFEEFVFLPDCNLPDGADPRQHFCSYYYFRPSAVRLMRAWRRDTGLTSLPSGGHLLEGGDLRLHDETGVLRHYPLLSPDHVRHKYLTRPYAPESIARGWHHNRIGLKPEDLSLDGPAVRRLSRWDSRSFDRLAPVSRHCWEPGELATAPAD